MCKPGEVVLHPIKIPLTANQLASELKRKWFHDDATAGTMD